MGIAKSRASQTIGIPSAVQRSLCMSDSLKICVVLACGQKIYIRRRQQERLPGIHGRKQFFVGLEIRSKASIGIPKTP